MQARLNGLVGRIQTCDTDDFKGCSFLTYYCILISKEATRNVGPLLILIPLPGKMSTVPHKWIRKALVMSLLHVNVGGGRVP